MLRLAPFAIAALVLSGCSSSDTAASLVPVTASAAVPVDMPTSTPPRSVGTDPAAPAGTLALASPVVSVAPAAVSSALAATQLEIVPVTGAPSAAIGPMSRAMAARGREVGLNFTRGGTVTTHKLKGFFSVNDDGREVRVVYIWDVLDRSGQRVHRIRGQEVIAGTLGGRDPWGAVTQATMERIGRTTIDGFVRWRNA